nr:hypothetical protein [Tanacetum cinerariifolium]
MQLLNPLPEGWSIRTGVWSICLGEGEENAFVVINLSGEIVKYNLISNTNTEIFDIGSNHMDDDDDVVLFIPPFEVDPNIYEFILSLARKIFESCGCLLLVCRDDIGSTEFTIYEMMKGSFVWSVSCLEYLFGRRGRGCFCGDKLIRKEEGGGDNCGVGSGGGSGWWRSLCLVVVCKGNDQVEALSSDKEVTDECLDDEQVGESRPSKRIRVTQKEMVKDQKSKKA